MLKLKINLSMDRDLEKKNNAEIIQEQNQYLSIQVLHFSSNLEKSDLIYKQINLVAGRMFVPQDFILAISQLRKIRFRNINMIGTLSSQSL